MKKKAKKPNDFVQPKFVRKVRSTKNKNNTSGYLGVNWSEEKKRWHAKLGFRNRRIHIGYFIDEEEAFRAYVKKKKELGLV